MSSIANIFADIGYNVSGSDNNLTPYMKLLSNKINVYIGYNIINIELKYVPKYVPNKTIIIASDIIDNSNVELAYCIKNKLNLISRYELIQSLTYNKISIGITGSHGKSTTSSLCAHLFDSSFMLGCIPKNYNINGRYDNSLLQLTNKSKYFVFELDESNKQFSTVKVTNMIITNINNDHVELYDSEQNLKEHFKNLNINNLIYCGDHI